MVYACIHEAMERLVGEGGKKGRGGRGGDGRGGVPRLQVVN